MFPQKPHTHTLHISQWGIKVNSETCLNFCFLSIMF